MVGIKANKLFGFFFFSKHHCSSDQEGGYEDLGLGKVQQAIKLVWSLVVTDEWRVQERTFVLSNAWDQA